MHPDNIGMNGLVVLAAVLTSVTGFAVIVRSLIRFILIRSPWWDDYTAILASIFTFGYLAELLVSGANGLGSPATTLTMDQMIAFLKVTLSVEITYYVIVGLVKTSILFTYLRFAFDKWFKYACYGTIAFEIIFTVICVIVMVTQCVPLDKMWDFTDSVSGICINSTAMFYSTSGINILTDVWILALPIKTLMFVHRPLREKLALIVIFGAGIVATIMSIIRLNSIRIFTLSTDPFHDGIPIDVWSMIEINVAILCVSVPALKPLLTPRRLQKAAHDRKYGSQAGDNPKPCSQQNRSGLSGKVSKAQIVANINSDAENLGHSPAGSKRTSATAGAEDFKDCITSDPRMLKEEHFSAV